MQCEIRNREYIQQVKNFAGLKWGTIRPTDIDVFIDFKDYLFVFIEVKHGDGMPQTGQRLAIERICDACANEYRTSVAIVAKHEAKEDIIIAEAMVISYRINKKWHKPKRDINVLQAVNKLREQFLPK